MSVLKLLWKYLPTFTSSGRTSKLLLDAEVITLRSEFRLKMLIIDESDFGIDQSTGVGAGD